MKVISLEPLIKFPCMPVLILSFFSVAYSSHVFAGLPPQGKQAWEFMEGPSKKYEDPSMDGDLFALMNHSEIVFSGRIQSVIQVNPGLMPVPMTKIVFDNIREYKGRLPASKSFIYPLPVKTLQFGQGAEVIVVLKRFDPQNFEIVKLVKRTKANLSLAKTVHDQTQSSLVINKSEKPTD